MLLVAAPVALLAFGHDSMVSLVSGAACAVVPQAYFAFSLMRAQGSSAQRAARLGLAAEGGKFLLSATLFALVFALVKPQQPGLVFMGFGMFWVIQLVESIRMLSRQNV